MLYRSLDWEHNDGKKYYKEIVFLSNCMRYLLVPTYRVIEHPVDRPPSLSNNCAVQTHLIPRVSTDFNAPNKEQVFEFMDKAILDSGVNLIDTVCLDVKMLCYLFLSTCTFLLRRHDSSCILLLQIFLTRLNNILSPAMEKLHQREIQSLLLVNG